MDAAMPAYYTREYVRQVQMALNEKTKMSLPTTGRFNAGWAEVLKGYQINHGLLPTAKYDQATKEELEPFIQLKYLQDSDYDGAAAILGCTREVMQALIATFLTGSGFISNGRCRIAFSRDKFYVELRKQYSEEYLAELSKKHPAIVQLTGGGYLCDDYEYVRFVNAITIDSYSAMFSTNWGMFQIPGANYRLCGYSKITEFAFDMQHSERRQLYAWATFIKNTKALIQAVQSKKWVDFCREYLGEAYALYQYDLRLERNYAAFTKKKKAEVSA